jgi:hypothetical protein
MAAVRVFKAEFRISIAQRILDGESVSSLDRKAVTRKAVPVLVPPPSVPSSLRPLLPGPTYGHNYFASRFTTTRALIGDRSTGEMLGLSLDQMKSKEEIGMNRLS